MSDLISRQAAIEAIKEEWDGCCSEYPATQIIYDTTEAIERLPIIQPKRGTWIDTGSNEEWYAREYRCSECGDTMLGDANFCPNCGADMRQKGENSENN